MRKVPHSFEVHSNESACRKKVRLGLEQVIYNTVGFRKRKRCPSRNKKGQQKQTIHDFSASRAEIGIHNSNAQQIASALVGDHQLIDSHRIPTKTDVKRERSS